MMTTRKEIGYFLKNKIKNKFDVVELSNLADDFYFETKERSKEVDSILNRISLMYAGPEFEYSQRELFCLLIC